MWIVLNVCARNDQIPILHKSIVLFPEKSSKTQQKRSNIPEQYRNVGKSTKTFKIPKRKNADGSCETIDLTSDDTPTKTITNRMSEIMIQNKKKVETIGLNYDKYGSVSTYDVQQSRWGNKTKSPESSRNCSVRDSAQRNYREPRYRDPRDSPKRYQPKEPRKPQSKRNCSPSDSESEISTYRNTRGNHERSWNNYSTSRNKKNSEASSDSGRNERASERRDVRSWDNLNFEDPNYKKYDPKDYEWMTTSSRDNYDIYQSKQSEPERSYDSNRSNSDTYWGGQGDLKKYEYLALKYNSDKFSNDPNLKVGPFEKEKDWSSDDEDQSGPSFMVPSYSLPGQGSKKKDENWDDLEEAPGYCFQEKIDDEVSRKERRKRYRHRIEVDFEQNLKELFEDHISYQTKNPNIHCAVDWESDFGEPGIWQHEEPLPKWVAKFANCPEIVELLGPDITENVLEEDITPVPEPEPQKLENVIQPFLIPIKIIEVMVPPGFEPSFLPKKPIENPAEKSVEKPVALVDSFEMESEASYPDDVSLYEYENTVMTIPKNFKSFEKHPPVEENWDDEEYGTDFKLVPGNNFHY